MQDGEIRKAFQRSLGKQGMKFKLGIKVNSAELKNGGVELKMEPAKGGKEETVQADIVLVSAGGLPGLSWRHVVSRAVHRWFRFPPCASFVQVACLVWVLV